VSDVLPKRPQTTKILLLPWRSNILALAAVHSPKSNVADRW